MVQVAEMNRCGVSCALREEFLHGKGAQGLAGLPGGLECPSLEALSARGWDRVGTGHRVVSGVLEVFSGLTDAVTLPRISRAWPCSAPMEQPSPPSIPSLAQPLFLPANAH